MAVRVKFKVQSATEESSTETVLVFRMQMVCYLTSSNIYYAVAEVMLGSARDDRYKDECSQFFILILLVFLGSGLGKEEMELPACNSDSN